MLKLKDEILLDEIEDALVLLDPIQERVVLMQGEEKILLQSLLSMPIKNVIDKMLTLYNGEEEKIAQDVKMFYNKLLDNGFAEKMEA